MRGGVDEGRRQGCGGTSNSVVIFEALLCDGVVLNDIILKCFYAMYENGGGAKY